MHKHYLRPSFHPDYEECEDCGTLINQKPFDHAAVYGGDYWNQPGRSTLAEQVYNVATYENPEGVTKIQAVLEHCPVGVAVLEIACAPGSLMEQLHRNFDEILGIEVDERYRQQIQKIGGPRSYVFTGYFPELTKCWRSGTYDCIIGMDILEHAEDGEAFMTEVHRLLKPGGAGIFMLPMLMDDGQPIPDGMFCDEHRAIYTQRYVKEWMGEMFGEVKFDRWVAGHEIVVVKK